MLWLIWYIKDAAEAAEEKGEEIMVFTHLLALKRAIQSLSESTKATFVLGGVSAYVDGRSSPYVSGRRVEYSHSCEPDGAQNLRYQLAFAEPTGRPEALEGYEHEWRCLCVPESLLEPVRAEFVLYFGRAPWPRGCGLVQVWVATRVLEGWGEDGRPRYKYAAAEEPEPELVLPPLCPPTYPPPPEWPADQTE